MKTITLTQYKEICQAAQEEFSGWQHEDYFGENLSITPQGKCLWEQNNCWYNSKSDAQHEVRQHIFATNISTIYSQRSILDAIRLREETDEDRRTGYTVQNLEKTIPYLISALQSVFGLTSEEIELAILREIERRNACIIRNDRRETECKSEDTSNERIAKIRKIEEEMKIELLHPQLLERHHQFCIEYLKSKN